MNTVPGVWLKVSQIRASLAEAGCQPAEELAAADGVEDEDRQRRQDDRGEDGGHVDAVLALERTTAPAAGCACSGSG